MSCLHNHPCVAHGFGSPTCAWWRLDNEELLARFVKLPICQPFAGHRKQRLAGLLQDLVHAASHHRVSMQAECVHSIDQCPTLHRRVFN